ncbi:MAG: glycosyltransferase family 2 protein, partial [Actinomycetota bacterium]|nr:glycosyltransferase family 2 protein [Actinomycetota bacterium]
MRAASYVLPLKWSAADSTPAQIEELAGYLRRLARELDDVIVVDGSDPEVYARHAQAWGDCVRQLPPDPRLHFANGKVNGVVTGVAAARHDKVVLADDDVRYDAGGLDRVLALLDGAEIVRPQNVFDRWPWHARWDTARSLLNRAWTADYPGTFGLRRAVFVHAGGYDGDALFENLEMIRTLEAHGAREARPLDLFVVRAAPEADRFWNQRPRQAYDDFAQPGRLALWLSVLPAVARCVARRRPRALVAG